MPPQGEPGGIAGLHRAAFMCIPPDRKGQTS